MHDYGIAQHVLYISAILCPSSAAAKQMYENLAELNTALTFKKEDELHKGTQLANRRELD